MKVYKAKKNHPLKKTFLISNLTYISKRPWPSLMNGEEMEDPIEVIQHKVNKVPRLGVGGQPYKEKLYSIKKGSSRINAAVLKGYDAIEGIIINA